MDKLFILAEMWERLWDFLIYPILEMLGYGDIKSPYDKEEE